MAEKVEEARLTPALREAVTLELDRALVQYMSKETVARGRDRDLIMSAVINEVIGLGPIEPLWSDRRITEVMVNGPREVFVEIAGRNVKATGVVFRDAAHLLDVLGVEVAVGEGGGGDIGIPPKRFVAHGAVEKRQVAEGPQPGRCDLRRKGSDLVIHHPRQMP